jgi:hypothetical protein
MERRAVEALASAGVSQGRISHEVLYLLPPEFVRQYMELFEKALKEDTRGGGSGDPDAVTRSVPGGLKTPGRRPKKDAEGNALPGSGTGARGGGKRYKTYWVIRNEDALEFKAQVDRKLRELSRDIARGKVKKAIRCRPCGRWGQDGMRFCPNCGGRFAEDRDAD